MPKKITSAARPSTRESGADRATDLPLFAFARQVRGWADTLLNVTGNATDIGFTLAQAKAKDRKQ